MTATLAPRRNGKSPCAVRCPTTRTCCGSSPTKSSIATMAAATRRRSCARGRHGARPRGSGGGKICYIASQIVGATGRVIGVDANEDMLALATKYRGEIGARIGYHNVEFRKGRIQDLKLDLALVDAYLAETPVRSTATRRGSSRSARRSAPTGPHCRRLGRRRPVELRAEPRAAGGQAASLRRDVPAASRRGGDVAISDIVSDEDVPRSMQRDPELWSGWAFPEPSGRMRFSRPSIERVSTAWRSSSATTCSGGSSTESSFGR